MNSSGLEKRCFLLMLVHSGTAGHHVGIFKGLPQPGPFLVVAFTNCGTTSRSCWCVSLSYLFGSNCKIKLTSTTKGPLFKLPFLNVPILPVVEQKAHQDMVLQVAAISIVQGFAVVRIE